MKKQVAIDIKKVILFSLKEMKLKKIYSKSLLREFLKNYLLNLNKKSQKIQVQIFSKVYERIFALLTLITAMTFILTMPTTALYAQDDILQENDFLEAPDEIPNMDEDATAPSPSTFTPTPATGTGSAPAKSAFSGTKKRLTTTKPPLSEATDADMTNENYPDLIDSFDFPNANIADVIKSISELTGKNFIVDPNVSGNITIMAPTQITVAEAYKVFLSALAIRGFAVVPSGKFYKILNVRDAQKENIEIYSGAYTPDTDQMITRIIHLKYIPAAEMNKFTSKLVSKNGNIDIYEPTNSLIVSDQASSVQRLMKIVDQLDIAGFDEQMSVIPIKYAKAKDIADLIDQIINADSKKSGNTGFSGGIPRFRPGGGQSTSSSNRAFSTIIPDDRTNSVIVVGNKAGIEKIKKLVRTLDFQLSESSGGAYVYYVKYGDAEKIADILNGIAKSLKDDEKNKQPGGRAVGPNNPFVPAFGDGFSPPGINTPQSSGLFGSDVKISAMADTNSLVIVGNKQDYQAILDLLKKIDIPRDQVYVETIIMEMSAKDSDSFGLSYYQFDKDSKGMGRIGFGGGNMDTIQNIGAQGAILGFGAGDLVDVQVGDKTVKVKSLMGFLNLLRQNTKTDVLATPQIIAMDNEDATVEVGEDVPVGMSGTVGTNGTAANTVERVKATIKLEIKPHISPSSETIRMKIKQSIIQLSSSPVEGAPELSKISRPTINRALDTNIVIRDGDTAVLGGLMRDDEQKQVSKVPLLGDIPILGWLFKSQTSSVEKRNLLVFLTPKIIRNPDDNSRLLNTKLDERVQFIKDNLGGKDNHGSFTEGLRSKNSVQGSAPSKDIEDLDTNDNVDDEFMEQ